MEAGDRVWLSLHLGASAESGEACQDMQGFIFTVQDGRFQGRLHRAIQGRGAFGRFRDLLAESRREQGRWFEFKKQRLRERVTEWLEEEEIDATIEFEAGPEPSVLEPRE